MFVLKRSQHNPILVPARDHFWEAAATFNMSVVKVGELYHGYYRAISENDKLRVPDQISIIGHAASADGFHFENRSPFIVPQQKWEQFGAEDPRITYFEGKYYIFYTALSEFPFRASGIKIAVAISPDGHTISEKHLVTPFNGKAMALFPERINGKIAVIFSAHTDEPPARMCIAAVDRLDELWSTEFWNEWHSRIDEWTIDPRRTPFDHVEVGAPPILTPFGWVLIYSHIQNYFPHPDKFDRIFGIEALLLDSLDPRKIVGRTNGAFMVPEEPYEKEGYVENIVFPSGAIVGGRTLSIYYGAADTSACRADVDIVDFVSTIHPAARDKYKLTRLSGEPILRPVENHDWEKKAVFNPGVIELDGKVHLLYRALSEDNTSTIGLAVSRDGVHIDERLPEPIYRPRQDFETKKIANANSGCEDARITKIGDLIYMCYTAFDGIGPPRVAITSISEGDFRARSWNWQKPVLITPRDVDDKDTCILSEQIDGKYLVLHRIAPDICGDYVDSLEFTSLTVNKCIRILGPRPGMWDGVKVGIAGPPIKTHAGWLLLYHAISKNHKTYRIGAALLDLADPTVVVARSTDPIFWPEKDFEKFGLVNNVVFSCGMVLRGETLFLYYGGADQVIGVAGMDIGILVDALVRGKRLTI